MHEGLEGLDLMHLIYLIGSFQQLLSRQRRSVCYSKLGINIKLNRELSEANTWQNQTLTLIRAS